jgi:hypothetical protein
MTNDADMTWDHGVSKMDVHKKSCEANPMDKNWLIFTPPDHIIPACPQCHDVIYGATCILDGEEQHIVHPCHHVLDRDEAALMIRSAVSI